MIFYKKNRGFTLAEILMIAGIVALIGSIILILSKGAIEKAKIAKLLNFSAQIHHALGAYLIAEYKFEESGDDTCPNPINPNYNDFCDTSGNENHGKNMNYSPFVSWESNNEIPQLGQAGYFSGDWNGPYIIVKESNSLVSESGFITVQAWIKPEEFGQGSGYNWIVGKGSDFYWIFYLWGKKLCFGGAFAVCSPDDVFEKGKWYHVVATWSKSEVKLFVNAEEVLSQPTSGGFEDDVSPIWIGYGSSDKFFQGHIDQVRIYSEPLSSSQIKKLYVEGLKKHLTMNNEQ